MTDKPRPGRAFVGGVVYCGFVVLLLHVASFCSLACLLLHRTCSVRVLACVFPPGLYCPFLLLLLTVLVATGLLYKNDPIPPTQPITAPPPSGGKARWGGPSPCGPSDRTRRRRRGSAGAGSPWGWRPRRRGGGFARGGSGRRWGGRRFRTVVVGVVVVVVMDVGGRDVGESTRVSPAVSHPLLLPPRSQTKPPHTSSGDTNHNTITYHVRTHPPRRGRPRARGAARRRGGRSAGAGRGSRAPTRKRWMWGAPASSCGCWRGGSPR